MAAREEQPFTDLQDLSRRAGLDAGQLEALATAGVVDGMSRREALWQAGWTESADHLDGLRMTPETPVLPEMNPVETLLADLWSTGVTPDSHPFAHLRGSLEAAGLPSVGELPHLESGRRITVAGLVTHRQRPGTAGGVTFLNLEDESGMLNVVCSAGVWGRYRKVATTNSVLLIRGILERNDGVTNLVADKLSPMSDLLTGAGDALEARHRSRDFR